MGADGPPTYGAPKAARKFCAPRQLKQTVLARHAWRGKQASPDNQGMKIGPAIRKLREEKGMTLEALAHSVGSDPSNLSRLERGRQKPGFDLLVELAAALGVRLSELFALAEGEEAELQEHDSVLKALVSKYQKLTPHHQTVVAELATCLLRLQKKDAE